MLFLEHLEVNATYSVLLHLHGYSYGPASSSSLLSYWEVHFLLPNPIFFQFHDSSFLYNEKEYHPLFSYWFCSHYYEQHWIAEALRCGEIICDSVFVAWQYFFYYLQFHCVGQAVLIAQLRLLVRSAIKVAFDVGNTCEKTFI